MASGFVIGLYAVPVIRLTWPPDTTEVLLILISETPPLISSQELLVNQYSLFCDKTL